MDHFYQTLTENTIYRVITGSTAYGLANEHINVDEKAIVILPPQYAFNLLNQWETETFHNPDIEFHSLKKAMKLLDSQNPTMLELLFIPDNYILVQTELGQRLRENRHLFLSQNCYYSFGGYAKDQLMRIKNGLEKVSEDEKTEHLNDILIRGLKQLKENYLMLESGELTINQVYVDNNRQDADLTVNFNNIPLSKLNVLVSELASTLKSHNKAHKRNYKPKEKLAKHAMHLIRLLKMGIEILEDGTLTVYRKTDRDHLLAIRNQKYTWDEIFTIADNLFERLDKAKQTSSLPEYTDKDAINKLYYELISDYYGI